MTDLEIILNEYDNHFENVKNENDNITLLKKGLTLNLNEMRWRK